MSDEKPEHSDPGAIQGHIALKGFFGICGEWDCSEEEMRLLLGGVSDRTLDDYLKLPHLMLSPEMLERISYIWEYTNHYERCTQMAYEQVAECVCLLASLHFPGYRLLSS